MSYQVKHCLHCGGDGIDPSVKTEEGKVARGECALPCYPCGGTGHIALLTADGKEGADDESPSTWQTMNPRLRKAKTSAIWTLLDEAAAMRSEDDAARAQLLEMAAGHLMWSLLTADEEEAADDE